MLNTFHWFISMFLKQNVRVKVAVGFIPTTDLMHCAASVIKTDNVSPTIVQLEHCLFQKISHPYLRANKTLLHSKQCFMTTHTNKKIHIIFTIQGNLNEENLRGLDLNGCPMKSTHAINIVYELALKNI